MRRWSNLINFCNCPFALAKCFIILAAIKLYMGQSSVLIVPNRCFEKEGCFFQRELAGFIRYQEVGDIPYEGHKGRLN